jgi:hypothetical protein
MVLIYKMLQTDGTSMAGGTVRLSHRLGQEGLQAVLCGPGLLPLHTLFAQTDLTWTVGKSWVIVFGSLTALPFLFLFQSFVRTCPLKVERL